MNVTSKENTSRKFIINCFFVLLSFGLLGCLILKHYAGATADDTFFVLQLINYICFILWFFVCIYSDRRVVPFIIFTYQIFLLLLLYSYYTYYIGNSLGINPNDALFYQNFNEKIRQLPFSEALNAIWNEQRIEHSIGDFGFPLVRYFISKFFFFLDYEGINFVMLFVNAVANTFASLYLYKLARFFLNEENSKICMILWGLSSALVWISGSGLKDSIFSCITLISLYYMQSIFEGKRSFRTYFNFYLFLFLTIFFRIFTFLFIFFTYIARKYLKRLFFNFYVLGMIIFIILAYVGTDIFANIMPQLGALKLARNLNLEKSFGTASFFTNTMNFCLAWVSTIPAFYPWAEFRNLYVVTYSIVKFYFSFFFIFCFLKVLLNKEKKLYPIMLVLFFNIILTIVSVTSLEYRFALPVVYLYYIFILYLFENEDKWLCIFNRKISLGVANLIVAPICLVLFVYYNIH